VHLNLEADIGAAGAPLIINMTRDVPAAMCLLRRTTPQTLRALNQP